VVVATEALDESGSVIIGLDGRPLMTISHWQTWWANWPSNVSLIIAALFAVFMIFYFVRSALGKLKTSRISGH
jgi:hypothetical protein